MGDVGARVVVGPRAGRLVGALAGGGTSERNGDGVADVVLAGGTVRAMDPAAPVAEAVAVRGDVIVAVGSTAEIEAHRGAWTRAIDVAGGAVLPGFQDVAHEGAR